MPRPKIDNPLTESVLIRMDRRLYNQLTQYAKSENTKISSAARMALIKFIKEQQKI